MSPFSFSYRDHLIAKTTWTKSNCCNIHVPLAFSLTNFYALETFSAFIEALYLGVATNPPPKTKKSFKSWNLITRSFLPVYRRGADKPQDIVRKHEPKNVYWWNLKIKHSKGSCTGSNAFLLMIGHLYWKLLPWLHFTFGRLRQTVHDNMDYGPSHQYNCNRLLKPVSLTHL